MASGKSNKVQYLDTNVLEEGKRRIRHLFANYDEVWVAFSGGKDSLACMWLVRAVLDEMGRENEKVKAFFNDEEVIPDDVIDFVRMYCEQEPFTSKFDIAYMAYPMQSHIFLMGEHKPYIQWNPEREHIRTPPPYAHRQVHPDNVAIDQHDSNAMVLQWLGVKGKIAVVNGIRADESMNRYISSIAKKGRNNWLVGSNVKGIDFPRPIFDWRTHDLFKFFKEQGVHYGAIYDVQNYAGAELRVSTPLHDRSHSALVKLRETHPRFYEQILAIWPEVATQERYYSEMDTYAPIRRYEQSWKGILDYIHAEIDSPANQRLAMQAVKQARSNRERCKRVGKYATTDTYGFPILHVFKQIVTGKYAKGISPNISPSDADLEYEGGKRMTTKK